MTENRDNKKLITFLIKNMEQMTDKSREYLEGNYKEIFEAARTVCLSEEATVAYSQSLDKLREIKRGYEYAAETNYKKGEKIGIQKGEKIGIQKGERLQFEANVRHMRSLKIDDNQIAQLLNTTREAVASVL